MSKAPPAPPGMEIEVYTKWADIQPKLAKLYTGPDPMFTQKAVCECCKNIAVEAKECAGCRGIICVTCSEKQNGTCKKCSEPFTTLKPLHPVVQTLFDRATFRCPHHGCGIEDVPYGEYKSHIFDMCKNRYMDCPNNCGCDPFKASQLTTHKKTCLNEEIQCNACKSAVVRRGDMKKHLETECPNATMQCQRCSGTYNLSDETHDCIIHLRKMILGDRAAVADQMDKISTIFEQFNDHVSTQIVNLEERMTAQQKETTGLLDSFLALNQQVSQIQSSKLTSIQQSIEDSAKVASQRFTIPSLKMELPPMSTKQVVGPTFEVKKLPCIGCQSGKYFEYPALKKEDDRLFASTDFEQRVLTKIQACSGVGIYSLALQYSDGFDTPCIGSRSAYNSTVDIESHERIKVISIRAWKENYVQTLVMKGEKGEKQIKSQQSNGQMVEFKLGDHERIIGVHGYMDSNDDVRGFGLIIASKEKNE